MTEEETAALIKAMAGENGDLLLFAADKNKVVWDVLGALRLELARQMELLDKNEYKFLWITEFPLLEWSEEQNRFTAMHHRLPCRWKKTFSTSTVIREESVQKHMTSF